VDGSSSGQIRNFTVKCFGLATQTVTKAA